MTPPPPPPNNRRPSKPGGKKAGAKPAGNRPQGPRARPGQPDAPETPDPTINRDELRERMKAAIHRTPKNQRPDAARPEQDRPGADFAPRPGPRPGKRPPLRIQTTTLWEYPSQHYDSQETGRAVGLTKATMQGDKDYAGATPSWVIWQLLQRYTRKGDRVLDPMCGSGTTLDVCTDLARKGVGFDLAPSRPDIAQADARELPVHDESIDFVFLDPPYSTHIDYSDDPRCIGKLDAGELPEGVRTRGPDEPPPQAGQAYYEAMEEVLAECHRALKPSRYLGLYVSDSFRKEKGRKGGLFMPIGFELFAIMRDYFRPVDIIAVVRHNQKLARGNWHKAAEEQNFFLRGFNYLFIMKKEDR